MTTTVRDALAKRDGDDNKPVSVTAKIEADIRKSRNWFDSVAPAHIDADQFVSLCLGAVRRGDRLLTKAVVESPWSFMQAASECARLGLVPGETYHFAAFRNKQGKDGPYRYEVVGIVDYKGEVDQIYRAGGVHSVHCHVVRANDTFIWRPGEMEIPHHVIHAPEGSLQEGLADDAERGILTGVYAYCRMTSGGFSQPVVMGASTVGKHRAMAKTDKFWGPPWPGEGPWTEDMWRKTAIHKQFDRVPHSAEYLAEWLRGAAAVERAQPEVAARIARPAIEAAVVLEGSQQADEDGVKRSPAGDAGDAQDGAQPPPDPNLTDGPEAATPVPASQRPTRSQATRKLNKLFDDAGFGGKDNAEDRRAVVSWLLASPELIQFKELPDAEIIRAARELEALITEATRTGGNASEVLASSAAYYLTHDDRGNGETTGEENNA